jgi:methionine synthase II (cobalamin-independent)
VQVQRTSVLQSAFEPHCLATTIGSLPHTDVVRGTALMFENTPEIPSWVQLPKRALYENMLMQFTEGMPALVQDGDRIYFSTFISDFASQLTDFYERYLAATEDENPDALESFRISPQYAAGFSEFMAQLPEQVTLGTTLMLKGQVTGPFTLGTNLLDQNGRCSYYDDDLRDVIVKTIVMKALWQIARLSKFGLPLMIFLDEPSLLGFGKQTFLTISREDVIRDINEVAAAIHSQGGLAGVHCEENTDWSLLMETDLDILDFDAYDHMQAITLYPTELSAFLEQGGSLGWGVVPTLDREAAAAETIPSLVDRFEESLHRLVNKGFDRDLLLRRALITPSCGAGGVLTEPLAERVVGLLRGLSIVLRERYGFVKVVHCEKSRRPTTRCT